MLNEKPSVVIGIFSAVFGAVVALLGNYLLFVGTRDANSVELLKTAMARLAEVEAENKILRKEVSMLRLETSKLRESLERKVDPSSALRYAYEVLPVAAWIKCPRPSDGEFVMDFINREYESFYGVTKARYQGNTDADVWGEEIAAHYNALDKKVADLKGRSRGIEKVPQGGPFSGSDELVDTVVWKFHVEMSDGQQCVAGIAVQ